MTIRKLQPGDEDALENFLAGHPESSMFLRSNLRNSGLDYADAPYHGDYWSVFAVDDVIQGVLAHYWNGNIMIQAPDPAELDGLIQAFRCVAARPIGGVLGPAEQAGRVIAALGLSDAGFTKNVDDGLYTLNLSELQRPTGLDSHRDGFVPASQIDRPTLTRWIRAYLIEALGETDNEALTDRTADRVERTIKGTDCWALRVDGTPVAMSGFNARLPDTVQIGPVWTPPEHRNKGYARTLLALTLERAAEGVKRAILFTDAPAAIRAYEALG
ncbi:MAG: GNAT family N-acetyltransferase, partial [Hyphomicrobiaceae bacterium]